MDAKTPTVPTPSPLRVVESLTSKAARREAMRALHVGLAETEANIRSLLARDPALRNTDVRRLPLFTIPEPAFTISEEPAPRAPTSAVPPSPGPLADDRPNARDTRDAR